MRDSRTDFYGGFGSGVEPEIRIRGGSAQNGWRVGSRGGQQVVYQAGKPILDRDLNLSGEAVRSQIGTLLGFGSGQTGFVSSSNLDPRDDFHTGGVPVGFVDSTGTHTDRGVLRNAFLLPPLDLIVAGEPVRVELTQTATPGWNLVGLDPPTVYDGTPETVKRTDFVFIELWRALIAPAGRASGTVEILSAGDVTGGDLIQIGPYRLEAGPGPGQFAPDPDPDRLAQNIVLASQDPGWPGRAELTLTATGSQVEIHAVPGAAGNTYSLSVTVAVPGSMRVSGPFLTGGYDQPNRPGPTSLYRYGNRLSPVAISDEILDPTGQETCLRVEWQYRIRVTGEAEAVSFETNPDGFSSKSAGAVPSIFARAGRSVPVWAGNGIDTRSYPFCPADLQTTWLDSSAVPYGERDPALWVAGNGSEQAAKDLGALDGFVYAVPIGFVFRRNDATGIRAGWSLTENQNGAVPMSHGLFTAPDGQVVPADKSDRPDGGFSDLIGPGDILDLRPHLGPPSLDGFLESEMARLLQMETRSWAGDGKALQGLTGQAGTEYVLAEEIGRTQGVPPSSGQTGVGRCVNNLSHLARTFSARPTVERVCFAIWPGSRPSLTAQGGPVLPGRVDPALYVVKAEKAPGVPIDPAGWTSGDRICIDLSRLDLSRLGGVFDGVGEVGGSGGVASVLFSDLVPPGTILSDLIGAEHDDGNRTGLVSREVRIRTCRGLATSLVEIDLLPNPTQVDGDGVRTELVGATQGSGRRILIEVEFTFPGRVGTFQTPSEPISPDPIWDGTIRGPGPVVELDRTQRPADLEQLIAPLSAGPAREVRLEYVANQTRTHAVPTPGVPIEESVISRGPRELVLPRRVWRGLLPTVTDEITGNPIRVDEVRTRFGSSDRTVWLSGSVSVDQGPCRVTYLAQDPIPNYGAVGYQVACLYRTAAPQTAGVRSGTGYLPPEMQLELLTAGPVWLCQGGAASSESDQLELRPDMIPLRDGAPFGAGQGEELMGASGLISTGGVSAPVGSYRVGSRYPVRSGAIIRLGGKLPGMGPGRDREGRAYYPVTQVGNRDLFCLAESLSGPARHKVAIPLLCRAVEDVSLPSGGLLFRQQSLVLLVLSRYAPLDPYGVVGPGEMFAATIFRVSGNRIGPFGPR